MKMNSIKDMSDVSKDIELIMIGNEDTFEGVLNKFYDIMRKHGIKRHIKSGEGWEKVLGETPEWKMCYALLIQQVSSYYHLIDFYSRLPEDLNHY